MNPLPMLTCRTLVQAGLVLLLAVPGAYAADSTAPVPSTHWEAAQKALTAADEAISAEKTVTTDKARADLARALADVKACLDYDDAKPNPGPWQGRAVVTDLEGVIVDYCEHQTFYLAKVPSVGVALNHLLNALDEMKQLPGGSEAGARYRVVDDIEHTFADTLAGIYHAQNPDAPTTTPAVVWLSPIVAIDQTGRAFVDKCLTDFATIKVGMTRAQIESKFPMDGGLQSASQVCFLHPACPDLKIEVEFSYKRDYADQGRAVESKDDIVIKVSKPYVERMTID